MDRVSKQLNAFEIIEESFIRALDLANSLDEGYWEYLYGFEYVDEETIIDKTIYDPTEIEKIKRSYKNNLTALYESIKGKFSDATIIWFKKRINQELQGLEPNVILDKIIRYQELCHKYEQRTSP